MSDLEPVTREEKLLDGQDLEPITRKEKFIKRIYDKTQTIPEPVTREEYFLKKAGEGGGGDVTIEQLNVSENGTYSEEGKAYSPVVVNVPSAVLGSLSVTSNGTYTPPSGVDGYNEVTVNVSLPQNALLLKDIPSTPTAIATFSDGAEMVMPSLKVAIEPQQEGSGDPSPTNIRPISGWDEVNVSVSGKNLFNPSSLTEGKTINSDGSIDNQANRSATVEGIPIQPNSRYTISYVESIRQGVFYYDKDDNFISFLAWGNNPRAFLTPSNAYYVRFSFEDGTAPTNVMLSIGETAQTYTAYNGHTYTIDLNGTRYGGTLDVVSGVLTVDRVGVDMGTLNWIGNVSNHHYYISLNSTPYDKSRGNEIICSCYKNDGATERVPYYSTNNGAFKWWAVTNTEHEIYVNDETTYASVDAFKTAMSGQILCYPLATPLTIQLTPTAVKSLEGDNNVFADSGEILEGEYLGGVS